MRSGLSRLGLRVGLWAAIAAAVVLATRVVVYALAPSELQLATELEQHAGGPRLAGVLTALILIAAGLAAAALSLAVVAVRERHALEGKPLVAAPRLSPGRLAARLSVLFVATSFGFAMLESYIHWRAGLGWHGLHCLVGPIHRDAIPILLGFSVLAVAVHGAVEHLLAWARRSFAALSPRLPLLRHAAQAAAHRCGERASLIVAPTDARGPPGLFVSRSSI